MDHPTDAAPAGLSSALLTALGPQGTAALLVVGAAVLTVKSPAFRRAEVRLIRASCRLAWRLIRSGVRRLRGIRTIKATAEERKILRRLDPSHWRSHAEARGLDGTITSRPQLTAAGITCSVRLDGRWTASKLLHDIDSVRALLGCRTALRIEITTGKRGGWAEITLRTRSAVDSADMSWLPSRMGLGLDTVTGMSVEIPLNTRMLLAGSSGSGKSVTLRPALAELAADPKCAIVMVDLKRVEGALWKTRARIARTAEEVEAVAAELVAEMMARLEELEAAGSASWTRSVARPRIVVLVDEGAEVTGVAKESMPALESIARMGRAAEIHLWWATQKPTMSGQSVGIPPQIAGQMDVRLCLRVATSSEVRTVLGEDATAAGWDAHTLPKPGVLLIRGTGRGPVPVKVWHMTDDQVRALPAAPVWSRGPGGDPGDPMPAELAPNLTAASGPSLVKAETKPKTNYGRVLDAVTAAGQPVRQKDIVEATGIAKGTVSKTVGRLVETGHLVRLTDGTGRVVAAVRSAVSA